MFNLQSYKYYFIEYKIESLATCKLCEKGFLEKYNLNLDSPLLQIAAVARNAHLENQRLFLYISISTIMHGMESLYTFISVWIVDWIIVLLREYFP